MEKDLTYKVKCRNCGKITEMYLGNTSQFTVTPTASFTPQVATGFGGKPMPVQPSQPEL